MAEKKEVANVEEYREAIINLIRLINDPKHLKKVYDIIFYYSKKS